MMCGAVAAEELTEAQEAVAKAGPKKLRLMIAGFGTVESMVQVDKWLGEQLQPQQNLEKPPTLDQGEKIQVAEVHNYIIRWTLPPPAVASTPAVGAAPQRHVSVAGFIP